MKKLSVTAPNRVVLREIESPTPGPGQVRIRVAYCGICGSDLHAYRGRHPFISLPFDPGHEFSGTVDALGEGVTELRVGDRVVCEPNLVCGECYNCSIGRYNICESLKVMGCQSDGAMGEYFLAPVEKTILLPESLSLRDAALIEPLSVGVHAVGRAEVPFNRNMVILGAGTIGLMVLVSAVKAGAREVTVLDLSDSRLAVARKLGATRVLNAGRADLLDELERVRTHEGYDVVFECVGVEQTANRAVEIVRKGGRVVVCGVFGEQIRFNMGLVQDREIEMIGSLMYTRRDVHGAIHLLNGGALDTALVISKEYQLDQAEEAFRQALHGEEVIKVLFNVAGDDGR
ncbi:MAG: alcohol dehydrogenase catalytic domain-containing protein [Spirochaetales bacterium]|nr:alcohol dehydrogenase catalytic domain-containing protein [Spirochaetales bacterium]